MKVLVVSANDALAQQISRALGNAGHSIRVSSGGPLATGPVTSGWPEVVIVDFDSPAVRGSQLLIAARQSGVNASFLLLREPGQRDVFPVLGRNHSVMKPVDAATIVREVESLGRKRPQHHRHHGGVRRPEESSRR